MCLLYILTPLLLVTLSTKSSEASMRPAGMGMEDFTTCEEFSRAARFNPYSVVGVWWFVFYYWASTSGTELFYFHKPTSAQAKYIHEVLDGQVTVPINWTARHVLMRDGRNGTNLLVERSDRGEYWLYILSKERRVSQSEKKSPIEKLAPLDIRFKQTSDNELIGIMDCEEVAYRHISIGPCTNMPVRMMPPSSRSIGSNTVFVLSRFKRIPRQKDIPDAVARIGYRGRRGRSYLYQGHEWLPYPEMNELQFWMPAALRQKLQYRFKDQ